MKFVGTRMTRSTRAGISKEGQQLMTTILNIDKLWGFDKGDLVKVSVWETYPDAPKYTSIRKVGRTGSSARITIPKSWGIPGGTWVYYTVESFSVDGDGNTDEGECADDDTGE